MYIQWLFEFVWRLFIQGPLQFIHFFTTENNWLGNLLKFSTSKGWQSFVSFLSFYSIFVMLMIVILFFTFTIKIVKLILSSDEVNVKIEIPFLIKEIIKIIVISILFPAVFLLIMVVFESIYQVAIKEFNKFDTNTNSISQYLYKLCLQGVSFTDNDLKNFALPQNFQFNDMNNINLLGSIVLVNSFSFFMIWICWSIFQKWLEVFFLYFTFPISSSLSISGYEISWRIWIKEICNKLIISFICLVMIRVFLNTFIIATNLWQGNNSSSTQPKKYFYYSLVLTFGLGNAIMFFIKYVAYKQKEHVGIFTMNNSYKQTRNFISKNSKYELSTVQKINLDPVNINVLKTRNDISQLRKTNQINFDALAKAKII